VRPDGGVDQLDVGPAVRLVSSENADGSGSNAATTALGLRCLNQASANPTFAPQSTMKGRSPSRPIS